MKSKRFKILLLVPLLAIQCAYYNTFYNAKEVFQKAEQQRKKNLRGRTPGTENQYYEKAIQKAFKVLENYPESKYVDDALMILGQSFFHQGKYLEAKRKFGELLTNFPSSRLATQAKLWLGETLLKLEEFVQAEAIFKELLSAEIDKKIRSESRFFLGELSFVQGDYSKAIETYNQCFNEATDRMIKAKARFRMGRCYKKLQDFQQAGENFLWVERNSPDRQLKFDAYFNYGLILKASSKYDLAMKVFSRLLENERNSNEFPKVRLEIAACQRFMNKETADKNGLTEAIEQYQSIIADFPRTEAAAEAYFRLGTIYLQELKDYAKAKENFDKVRSEYSRSEFITEAASWSSDIDKFFRLKQSIKAKQEQLSKLSSKNANGGVPVEEKQQKLSQNVVAEDSTSANRERQEKQDGKRSLDDENPEEIAEQLARDKFLLAELWLFKFSQVDSVLSLYADILKNHPKTIYAPKALYSSGYVFDNIQMNPSLADSLYRLLIELYPNSLYAERAREELKLPAPATVVDSAKAIFRRAEQELFEKGNVKKAIRIYRTVVDSYPHSPLAPKALYAVGWIYEHDLNANSQAIAIYQRLLKDFPQSPYSDEVRKKLAAIERKKKIENEVTPEAKESNSKKKADEERTLPPEVLH